jgi:hypothetical protein
VTGTEVDLHQRSGDDYVAHQDVTYGIVLAGDLSNSLQLKAEVNRLVKGADHEGSAFYERQPKTVTYLQIPVLLGYKLPFTSNVKMVVEAGAALNASVRPVKFDRDNYVPGTIFDNPALMASPVAGAEIGYFYQNTYLFLNYRHDFDRQKYFQRMSGTYYLQHAGGSALTVGLMFRTNKGSLKAQ